MHTTSREAMIAAAERLVAERGMRALTFNAVQKAAGQSNKSAVVYHFGSREGLIEAVIEARMGPVDRSRQELLDELGKAADPLTVRRVVRMHVEPLADSTLGRPGSYYARFLAQAVIDPALGDLVGKHLTESFRRVRQLLTDLSSAGDDAAAFRADSVVLFTLITLAVHEGRERTSAESHAIATELIDMLVAMLAAPTRSIDQ